MKIAGEQQPAEGAKQQRNVLVLPVLPDKKKKSVAAGSEKRVGGQ